MMRWWAAFFVCGLAYPPGTGETALVAIAAAVAAAAGAVVAGRGARMGGGAAAGGAPGGACARWAVLAACALVLWQAGGFAHAARETAPGAGPEGAGGGIAAFSMEGARSSLVSRLDDGRLSRRGRGFVAALVLGDRRGLPPALRDRYSYLGISHFLALSGLHLGVIAVPLAKLLSLLIRRRAARDAALLGLLAIYSSIACFPSSLVRALALSAAVMAYRFAGLHVDLAGSLIAGGFLIAALDENVILDAGFQLSFAAVMAIALIALPVIGMIDARFPRGAAGAGARLAAYPAVITCAVQFATLPLVVSLFGRAPVVSPVANVMVSLPFTALIYVGAAYVFAPVAPLRSVLAPMIEILCRFLDEAPSALAQGRHPAVIAGDGIPFVYGCGVVAAAVALAKSRTRRGPMLMAAGACVALSFGIPALIGVAPGSSRCAGSRGGDGPSLIAGRGYVYCGSGGGVVFLGKTFGASEAGRLAREIWKSGARKVAWCVLVPQSLPKRHGVLELARRIELEKIVCGACLAVRDRGRLSTLGERGTSIMIAAGESRLASRGLVVTVTAPKPPPPGEAIPAGESELRCVIVEPRFPGQTEGGRIDPDRPAPGSAR